MYQYISNNKVRNNDCVIHFRDQSCFFMHHRSPDLVMFDLPLLHKIKDLQNNIILLSPFFFYRSAVVEYDGPERVY